MGNQAQQLKEDQNKQNEVEKVKAVQIPFEPSPKKQPKTKVNQTVNFDEDVDENTFKKTLTISGSENIIQKETQNNTDLQDKGCGQIKSSKKESQLGKVLVQWNTFVKIKKKNYLEDYIFVKEIGKGAFGTVSKIKMKYGGLYRAAKVIKGAAFNKKLQDKEKFVNEIVIPMKLDHPNLNKLYEVFEWKNQFVLILELCEGGDLFNKIKKGNIFSEKKVSNILKQILSAIVYLHKNNIVHRDLKPENMLYDNDSNALKIIDFGTAIENKKKLTALVGTPYYIAPEVIKGSYDQKCDVWSCGVIMYLLLCGTPPFVGHTEKQILRKISTESIGFKDSIWKKRSTEAQQLVKKMLNKNPSERISAIEALNSQWLMNASDQENLMNGNHIIQNLQSFHFQNKLKAVVYTYIASQLYSNKDKEKLLQAFRQIDKDGDGVIGRQQLVSVFNDIGGAFSELQIDKILNLVDTNGSGLIDFTQFLVAASNEEELLQKERLENAFTYLDTDHSGYITPEQIRQFLDDTEETTQEIKKIFEEVDKNGDGKISKKQFLTLLLKKN